MISQVYHYFTRQELFTPFKASNISLESKWKQVSSGLYDSSHNSPSF